MTHSTPILVLRRAPLVRALARLPPLDLRVLLHLVLRASAATGRSWTTPARLAEELGMTVAFVGRVLERLEADSFVERSPAVSGRLTTIEVGDVLVRDDGAPEGLPYAP